MSAFFLDTRELRSFRFKYYAKEIHNVLISKQTNACFCIADSFYPIERQEWREQKINNELSITAIPNSIGRFLFQKEKKEWLGVRNLFKGQVFLIKSKLNAEINLTQIKQILELKKFSLRLFITKNQIYRSDIIKTRTMKNLNANKISTDMILSLQSKIIMLIFLAQQKKENI